VASGRTAGWQVSRVQLSLREINASFCCMCRLMERLHLRYFRPLCAELCLVRLPHRSLGPGIPDPPNGACGHGECLRGSLVGAGQKATTGTNLARVINCSRLMARAQHYSLLLFRSLLCRLLLLGFTRALVNRDGHIPLYALDSWAARTARVLLHLVCRLLPRLYAGFPC